MIHQHQSVLQLDPLQSDGEHMIFIQPENEEDLPTTSYSLPAYEWDHMGRPETVTVSCVPGDRLNVVDPLRDVPHSMQDSLDRALNRKAD